MAPRIKQENLPAMEDCRLRLKNAVNVKLNASANFKLTAIDALVIAGFDPEVARNQSMINRFHRLLQKSKPKEDADGEPPAPPAWSRLDQQLKAPPAPNPMPPPRPPALGGPLIDSRPPLSSVKAPPQAMETPSPLSVPESLRSQRNKNIYRTPHQVDVVSARRHAKASTEDEAMSAATRLYALEKQKPNGKSSVQVAAEVNLEFGSTLSASTLRRYAQGNRIGLGKLKQGRPGFIIPGEAYRVVCEAYYTHVRLVQEAGANGVREATKKYMDVDKAEVLIRKRIRPDLAFLLISGNPKKQDAARIEWTTDHNIAGWFDTWEEEMLELGFAERTKEGLFQYTHPERIINIDETFLTLDDATQPGLAGRPASVFFDPTCARTGRAANKSSLTCTGLFGSTATGVALPPHFQVKSTGNDESKRICTSIAATVPSRLPWIGGSW
jgi:hypothetical protein